jgi:hypothetical protein
MQVYHYIHGTVFGKCSAGIPGAGSWRTAGSGSSGNVHKKVVLTEALLDILNRSHYLSLFFKMEWRSREIRVPVVAVHRRNRNQ